MNIVMFGGGHVGLPTAVFWASHGHKVYVIVKDVAEAQTINENRVDLGEKWIRRFFASDSSKNIFASAALDGWLDIDLFMIALPTDWDAAQGSLNTDLITAALDKINTFYPQAVVIIKSTVPVNYVTQQQMQRPGMHLLHNPEFLCEGNSCYGLYFADRVVIGHCPRDTQIAHEYGQAIKETASSRSMGVCYMDTKEAAAVKLFSNAYLATRISFFNELDSYAQAADLDTEAIIKGVCADERIGMYYNHPSFGYGGACLPKDVQQLDAEFAEYNQYSSVLEGAYIANYKRLNDIVADLLIKSGESDCEVIGFYRLTSKDNADNFKGSVMLNVIDELSRRNHVNIIVYEPLLKDVNIFHHVLVVNDLDAFKQLSDLIVVDRMTTNSLHALKDVKDKIYTRDVV